MVSPLTWVLGPSGWRCESTRRGCPAVSVRDHPPRPVGPLGLHIEVWHPPVLWRTASSRSWVPLVKPIHIRCSTTSQRAWYSLIGLPTIVSDAREVMLFLPPQSMAPSLPSLCRALRSPCWCTPPSMSLFLPRCMRHERRCRLIVPRTNFNLFR